MRPNAVYIMLYVMLPPKRSKCTVRIPSNTVLASVVDGMNVRKMYVWPAASIASNTAMIRYGQAGFISRSLSALRGRSLSANRTTIDPMHLRAVLLALAATAFAAHLSGQWLDYKTPGIPRT